MELPGEDESGTTELELQSEKREENDRDEKPGARNLDELPREPESGTAKLGLPRKDESGTAELEMPGGSDTA